MVVALKAGGSRTVEAKAVMLATGARARAIPQIGLEPDGERIWTYREAMAPEGHAQVLIVVIGSGAIGIEFASFYRALGAEVTVVEAVDRILPVEDEEVSKAAQKAFEKRGMKFRIGAKVTKLSKTGTGVARSPSRPAARPRRWRPRCASSPVGITANVEDLGLEALGVKIDRGHIITDGHWPDQRAGPLRHRRRAPARPGWRTRPATRASTASSTSPASSTPERRTRPIPGCTYAQPAGRLGRA